MSTIPTLRESSSWIPTPLTPVTDGAKMACPSRTIIDRIPGSSSPVPLTTIFRKTHLALLNLTTRHDRSSLPDLASLFQILRHAEGAWNISIRLSVVIGMVSYQILKDVLQLFTTDVPRKHAVRYFHSCFKHLVLRIRCHTGRSRADPRGKPDRAPDSVVCADHAGEDVSPKDSGPARICKWDHGSVVNNHSLLVRKWSLWCSTSPTREENPIRIDL